MDETVADLMRRVRGACLRDRIGRARELMLEALDRCSGHKLECSALAMERLAQVEWTAGDHQAAHLHLLDAAALAETEGNLAALVALLRQIGDLDCSMGRVERAERFYEEALILCQGRRRVASAVHAGLLRSVARLWSALGQEVEAAVLRQEAQRMLARSLAGAEGHIPWPETAGRSPDSRGRRALNAEPGRNPARA